MLKGNVSSIMLPLSEYGVVGSGATLTEAIEVLEHSKAGVAAKNHPHRAVLVQDESGEIVGKLGHRTFLKALLPESREWNSADILRRAGVSSDMIQSSTDMFEIISDNVLDLCQLGKSICVADVCTPATEHIEHDASLVDATRKFLSNTTLSLLVKEKDKTVGVLRLADLFDEVARQVTDCESEKG